MRATLLRAIGATALVGALLVAGGCVRVELPAPEFTSDSDRVSLGTADELVATIDMGAGKLMVSGGATALMEADYEFSNESWKPVVEYEESGREGRLSVRTPSKVGLTLGKQNRYEWDIRLNDGLPLDLSVNMGAGESDLDLRGLDLRRLDINLGAGESTIDLSGTWTHDLEGSIEAGAGEVTLRVPENVGVRIVGYRDGIGSYSADGFKQDGDALVNDAYDDADVRFDLTLRRGVGEVHVEMVP